MRDPRALLAWLTQTVRRCALDQRRTSLLVPPPIHRDAPEDRLAQRRDLARALVRLSDDDRRLFERYYLGGQTTARIAAQFRFTDAAVRKRLERIRQRIRKEIHMVASSDLPQRIIDLLARPILTDLPANPVGAVWEDIRAGLPDYTEVTVPEQVTFADGVRLYGDHVREPIERTLHVIDDQRFLRGDVTLPLLLEAEGKPAGTKLMTVGKAFRNSEIDATHLQAFHQAEALWIDEGIDAWALTGWLMDSLHQIIGHRFYQFERCHDSIGGVCAWEVYARWHDGWTSVAAFGASSEHTVRALGYDPSRVSVVGVCFGLERLASLRYGIDDIRKVEIARVDER